MKILFCVSSMNMGGAERIAATLANEWSAKGHQVELMPTYSQGGESFYSLSHDVKLQFLSDLANNNRAGRLINYFLRLRTLRQHIRRERPDVIISFLTNVNVMLIIASMGLGIRTIVSERTDPFSAPLDIIFRFMRLLLYPFSDLLVVQTESVRKKYTRTFRPLPDIEVIGNPVTDDFIKGQSWSTHKSHSKTLLTIGRLHPSKGLDNLIRTFGALRQTHPDWILRIVGEGPQRCQLEALIAELGLSDSVELPGRTFDVKGELLAAEIFVLASDYEGFPNALLEAMAVGVPSVAVDCPSGPREISENGDAALLVPPGDKPALQEALSRLMRDEALRLKLSKAGRQSVQRRFSIDKIATHWEKAMCRS